MEEEQLELLRKTRHIGEELVQLDKEYWEVFSSFDTWQFWLVLTIFIVPLILLLIFIDKRKILLLGFYGLNIHVWVAYADTLGIRLGLWEYPYKLAPVIPSLSLDASLIPVTFILLYQWTLNNHKSFYLYSFLLSAAYAFGLKPLMTFFNFFHMLKGTNYFHLLLIYSAVFLFSKLITNLFIWLQQRATTEDKLLN